MALIRNCLLALGLTVLLPAAHAQVNPDAASIKKGGQGVWGPVPMPPPSGVSDEDLKTMAAWILSLSSR